MVMEADGRHVGRRGFLRTGVAAGAALAGGLAARPGGAQGKGKVRFAYLQLGWAACEIIHKEDLLGKRGWQAEYTVVPGSPAGLVNTFAAGNVDAIDMSFALSAKMFEDQVPVKVTGVATAVLGAIVARKDSGITKVEDLRGRKIAAVVGTTTFLDIRTLALKGYGFDVQKDTQLITAQAPPDMATMIAKKDVDAVIAWQPVSDLIVQRGDGVYLAKQIDLWRKATGRATGYPVHVCYAVSPSFIEKHPTFPKDLNDAQHDAVNLWNGNKARAVEIAAEITKLPPAVVEYAHGQTVQMLHGLSDEQIDTLVVQLKLIKETGFLKSDIWDNPDRIRKEFFWRPA
jgi:ABC-type nitrate/sulfonate/bicarbonate transport system substrate-binding protein